jgi:histidine kinase/DNA gyrase B/HSP90-like ATPase
LIVCGCKARIGSRKSISRKALQIPHFADITPDVSLLAKVGQSGHSVADAVAELVDNALDARVGQTVKVEVSYDAKVGWIEISDTGCGMTRPELADALVLGLSGKSNDQIGRFGLGLKTACTSLGPRFRITTTPADGKVEWIAEYDEEKFLESGKWMLPLRRQKKSQKRGTRIRVESSRLYNGLDQSLRRNLGSTFRHFIDDGILQLRLNGSDVQAVHQEVDEHSVLPLAGNVAGHPIRGWVGLLQVSSQRGWYGFSLVRNRRVIRRHEKLGFQPHPSTARVTGELHLDQFLVNNLKTDFIRETPVWHALERWVSEHIEPVLAASRALAHAGTFDSQAKTVLAKERERILSALDPEDVVLPSSPGTPVDASGAVNVVLGTIHTAHRFEAAGASSSHVRVEYNARVEDADLIVVYTNVDHPAMTAADPSQLASHNLAEAAALAIGEKDEFIALKSQLLAALFEQRVVRRALRDSLKAWLDGHPRVEESLVAG